MTTVKMRNADHKVRQEIRAAVEEVLSARSRMEQTRSSGMYTEEYLSETRRKIADEARGKVTGYLEGAAEVVQAAEKSANKRIEEARHVDPSRLAIATTQLQMVLGDSLRQDPEKLLSVYEASFDDPVDRRAIEDLAEKLMRVMTDSPENRIFAHKWAEVERSLESKLPKEEREARRDLAELEAVSGYLGHAQQIMDHAVKRLSGEVAQDTMIYGTTRYYAIEYEKQKGDEAPTERMPYDFGMGAQKWDG